MSLPFQIDGKEILSEISSGGHAIVYKAWDSVLETYYAIKLMRKEASENADRFLTEAKILAQLKHPNIPSILSFGKYEDRPFIRMDFIDGRNLDEIILEKGKLPPAIAVAVAIQVAKALEYAHTIEYEIYGEKRKGIIHRDLKPGNVLIDKSGTVKLIDFGIAKVDKLSIHTSATSILGTPYYMSPEQIDPPDDEPLDGRTDIYSLGCVLYECLTGECQFEADTITIVHGRKKTGKYDKSALLKFPPKLRKIISTATAPERDDRYSDFSEMVRDLESILEKASVEDTSDCLKKYIDSGTYPDVSNSSISWRAFLMILLFAATALMTVIFFRPFFPIDKTIANHSQSRFSDRDSAKTAGTKPREENSKDTVRKTINSAFPHQKDKTSKHHERRLSEKSVTESRNQPKTLSNQKQTIQELFNQLKYDEIIQKLSPKNVNELNDSMFLYLCGSLLHRDVENLGNIVFSRSMDDGYLYYLRGRYLFSRKKWELARNWFLKSMTLPSIINIEKHSLFYLANAAYSQYREKPNIQNRDFFLDQKKEYLSKFCDNNPDENCIKIQKMIPIGL